jgi:L-threonylcarbamoyladenylate synthase
VPNNPEGMAKKLYDILHQMDALKVAKLLIENPPISPEWLAIHDRLTRAAHKIQ